MAAAILAALAAAFTLPTPARTAGRATTARMSGAFDLGLADAEQTILAAVKPGDAVGDDAAALVALHDTSIAPLRAALWRSDMSRDDRKIAICDLSRSMDEIDNLVRGPLLSGKSLSVADAKLFPSFCLMHKTLPQHFGWKEWTDEAFFWKRPRLHVRRVGSSAVRVSLRMLTPWLLIIQAWFEVIQYERAARTAEMQVASALDALQVDWEEISMNVPTAHIRTMPRHAF